MHARKLPRISEPSFDRDYYDGGGQSDRSSSGKSYSSSRYSSNKMKSNFDRHLYRRSPSPGVQERHARGPGGRRGGDRDRDYYSNKYSGRFRSNEGGARDRDRDRERDRCRSPLRSSSRKWESSSRGGNNGDKDSTSNSVSHEPKLRSVGEWTEHTSSSGKKYYYNSTSEVSQWEKPKEWIDYERSRGNGSKISCDRRSNNSDNNRSSSMRSSNARGGDRLRDEPDYSRSKDRDRDRMRDHRDSRHHHKPEKNGGGSSGNRDRDYNSHREDMDISSSRDATPTSENEDSNNLKQYSLGGPSGNGGGLGGSQFPNSAALPQMASHPEQQNSTQHFPKSDGGGAYHHHHHHHHHHRLGGPPTPTHSEGQDQEQRPILQSLANVYNATTTQSTASSGSLPHSPLTLGLKPQPAVISSSLSRLYREELINHVIGWPAEAVEKTCQRVNEDHQNISNLAITRVSAELKMARSLVRLADIQATLQEQRVMFLRQHTHDLESIKPQSTTSMHSEDQQHQTRPSPATAAGAPPTATQTSIDHHSSATAGMGSSNSLSSASVR